jgi:large subunit ribosomal protein L10
MNKNKQIKELKVAEIKGKMEKSQSMVFTKYQGLTVEEDTQLRKKLRDAGVDYKVYKNSLSTIAAKELGFDGAIDLFKGPISIAFGFEDPTIAARILDEFAKTHKKVELKGGVIEGIVYDAAKIKEIASVPSRDVLLAKLLGSFNAPISNFVYALSAIAEKKETEA